MNQHLPRKPQAVKTELDKSLELGEHLRRRLPKQPLPPIFVDAEGCPAGERPRCEYCNGPMRWLRPVLKEPGYWVCAEYRRTLNWKRAARL